MVFITLNVVNTIIPPFIAITWNIHVIFKPWICNIFSKVTSWHLLLIFQFFCQKVTKLRIDFCNRIAFFRKLDTYSEQATWIKNPDIDPYGFSNFGLNIHAILQNKIFRYTCNSWSCIEFIKISHNLFLGQKKRSFKI